MRSSKKANSNFKKNLKLLLTKGEVDRNSRPVYVSDGAPSQTLFLTNVYEEYNLLKGESPIHNFRPTAMKMAVAEIIWIYVLQTSSLLPLRAMGVNWWDDWDMMGKIDYRKLPAEVMDGLSFMPDYLLNEPNVGFAYGYTVKANDLINTLLSDMQTKPFSRDHILSLWQSRETKAQKIYKGLSPCAYSTKWNIVQSFRPRSGKEIRYIDYTLFQRSADYITAGSSINKLQYWALGLMIAGHLTKVTGIEHKLRKKGHWTDNLHIYDRHIPAAKELLEKEAIVTDEVDGNKTPQFIRLKRRKLFWNYKLEDFEFFKVPTPTLDNPLEIAK